MRLAPFHVDKRGRTVALLFAVLCALVAFSRVYTSFERVRVKIVEAALIADGESVRVTTPDLSAFDGQATAIIIRVRNDAPDPRRFSLAVDGTELASFAVGPGRLARVDRSLADGIHLAGAERIDVAADGGDWSLQYLELANTHGHSTGALELVIVPAAATSSVGAARLLVLPLLVVLVLLAGAAPAPSSRWAGIAGLAAATIVAAFFASVLVAPWVSPFKVLLSPRAFLLLTAVGYFRQLYRVVEMAASKTRQALDLGAGRVSPRAPILGYAAIVVAWCLYLGVALVSTSYSAGGADSAGYLTTARWLRGGSIVRPITALDRLDMPVEASAYFVPLGTILGPEPGTMAPYYSGGLPAHMMLAAMIGGSESFSFLISPLAAALGLLVMFALAREIGLSRPHSVAAAVVLGVCPTYVYQALFPMSDVLATLWAMLSILAALRSRESGVWAFAAGAAFGIAVTVRPANALMLLPLAMALKPTLSTWLRFGIGGLPFAALFSLYNHFAYGNALSTGYSYHLADDMRVAHFLPRFRHYSYWIAATLTPLVPLGWLVSIGDRRAKLHLRCMLSAWFLAYFLFYCFYRHYDAWWFTRFLLPAFPALILAALVVLRDLPVPRLPSRRLIAHALVVGAIVWTGVAHHQRFLTFATRDTEATYRGTVDWVDDNVLPQTAVLSMQTSGAFAYYTDRIVARWDVLDDESLADLRERLGARGYGLVAALFPFEVDEMKERFEVRWRNIGTYRNVTFWVIDEPPG